jgi:hypothetical protein
VNWLLVLTVVVGGPILVVWGLVSLSDRRR